jgi:hypothetical protein
MRSMHTVVAHTAVVRVLALERREGICDGCCIVVPLKISYTYIHCLAGGNSEHHLSV